MTKLERTKGVVETLSRPSIDNPLEVNFDDKIILRGYNTNTTEITPGSKLNLTFFWQAVNNVQEDYNVFLHLRDETGHMVAQFDYQPFYGSYPTRHWQPGQALTDVQEIPIPADLNLLPGTYNLVIGFYNPNTLARLPLLNDQSGENAFYLTSLTVQ